MSMELPDWRFWEMDSVIFILQSGEMRSWFKNAAKEMFIQISSFRWVDIFGTSTSPVEISLRYHNFDESIFSKYQDIQHFSKFFEHFKEKFQNCADQMKKMNSTLFDPFVTEPIEIDFAKAFYFKDEYISLLIKTTHLPTGFEVCKNLFSYRVVVFLTLCLYGIKSVWSKFFWPPGGVKLKFRWPWVLSSVKFSGNIRFYLSKSAFSESRLRHGYP